MDIKPKRRTRERILEASLRLFNDFGEPNVTTTVIADDLNISPGNLYYHFHNKDEIVEAIFAGFEREIEAILSVPTYRQADVDDIWLFLHLLFEQIWKFRFFYRDLNDLLTRNRTLEIHFKQILAHVESRLHLLPNFRERILRVPLDLDYPYWVEDEHFNIEHHVRHIAVPKPSCMH